jgi:cryptochrome
VYSPITFGKKYDPSGKFVRHFLPVLKKFPDKYIYEPWTAPKAVQEKAGCIIGIDYPEPLVDHAKASQENKSKMKEAYEAFRRGEPMPEPLVHGDGPAAIDDDGEGTQSIRSVQKRKMPDA